MSRVRLTRIVILTNFGSICRKLGIFSSSLDSKLIPDAIGLQWNGQSKTFLNAYLRASGLKYSPLYFKTERVAETVLRESWFWPTSGRFPGAWRIYSSPASCKLTSYGLRFRRNGQSRTLLTLTFSLVGLNRSPLHFNPEKVAETALSASWFWPSSARLSGTWGIFSSPGDSKLTPDGLG